MLSDTRTRPAHISLIMVVILVFLLEICKNVSSNTERHTEAVKMTSLVRRGEK